MKINFYSFGSSALGYPTWYQADSPDYIFYFDETLFHKIRGIIKSRFESIEFKPDIEDIIFWFDDPADEAAFLLWSNDGIEI